MTGFRPTQPQVRFMTEMQQIERICHNSLK